MLEDAYNAIKLYKLLVKEDPHWIAPYLRLGHIYKYRCEWKPAFHYTKKALALDSSQRDAWWDFSIAAAALHKWGLARSIWSKFGHQPEAPWRAQPVSIRLRYGSQFELLWADTCDPVRAKIRNIPDPMSDRRFGDIILMDGSVAGYHVVDRRRFPVFAELGLFKRSTYHTYSCLIQVRQNDDIDLLDQLARKANLGFEIWSNAQRTYTAPNRVPEYHGPGPGSRSDMAGTLHIALAAQREREVLNLLQDWKVICLGSYEKLQRHL